jgi:predicted nucleic acid-binding protein
MDLLRKIIGEIYTTPEVIIEFKNGVRKGHLFLSHVIEIIDQHDWILIAELKQKERHLFDNMPKRLVEGERSCLAIAYMRGWAYFTDDLLARLYAENSSISVTGTFGLLNIAIDENILSELEADEVLQAMIRNNYRSPYKSIFNYRNSILS